MNYEHVLESMSKEELVELLVSYSDAGYFPLELFVLNASDYDFSIEELKAAWEQVMQQVSTLNDEKNPKAAELLRDTSSLLFEQARKLSDDRRYRLMEKMVEDLTDAAEEQGIGMDEDSEWEYLQIRDEIQEYLE
ncbi:MAG: hypothetical protein K6E79_08120 [Pseudobutyrivibrio sp.]|nr:hypothetical protein [Pseudobutyrivibrio sp.]